VCVLHQQVLLQSNDDFRLSGGDLRQPLVGQLTTDFLQNGHSHQGGVHLMPRPPNSSGTVMPVRPSSAS
jgi:hypothetical protein